MKKTEQQIKARKAYKRRKRITANSPNAGEWIALRLLFILLASDVSNTNLHDVAMTIEYFRKRFVKKDVFMESMAYLTKEHALMETFVNNPESKLVRDMNRTVRIEKQHGGFEDIDLLDRKYFGSTYIIKPGTTNE
jgi:hypothetical protein